MIDQTHIIIQLWNKISKIKRKTSVEGEIIDLEENKLIMKSIGWSKHTGKLNEFKLQTGEIPMI